MDDNAYGRHSVLTVARRDKPLFVVTTHPARLDPSSLTCVGRVEPNYRGRHRDDTKGNPFAASPRSRVALIVNRLALEGVDW